eukprot:6191817-Pleurochrysis_carterae.AAC.1
MTGNHYQRGSPKGDLLCVTEMVTKAWLKSGIVVPAVNIPKADDGVNPVGVGNIGESKVDAVEAIGVCKAFRADFVRALFSGRTNTLAARYTRT